MPLPTRYQRQTLFRGHELTRLMSMVVLLLLLWSLINQARQPSMWNWIAEPDNRSAETRAADLESSRDVESSPTAGSQEKIEPGPTDKEPAEWEAIKKEFAAVGDKTALGAEEMPAYWRLMKWSRSQSYADLRRRAEREVPFTKLFDDPDRFRGKLIGFKLHVRQVVDWEVSEDSNFGSGVERVYELRGATEQSLSFPYIVVVSELPAKMPRGMNVFEDVMFVGYFLKTMLYTDGLGTQRASPLLIGRLQWRQSPALKTRQQAGQDFWWMTVFGGAVLLAIVVASWRLGPKRRRAAVDPVQAETEEDAIRRFAEQSSADESSRSAES
ncbi:MAG: hypothetical protein HZA46_22860 [Planctomycetales bacterium]|nr:hypothetical protein [Planctomycetales bacterium]